MGQSSIKWFKWITDTIAALMVSSPKEAEKEEAGGVQEGS